MQALLIKMGRDLSSKQFGYGTKILREAGGKFNANTKVWSLPGDVLTAEAPHIKSALASLLRDGDIIDVTSAPTTSRPDYNAPGNHSNWKLPNGELHWDC